MIDAEEEPEQGDGLKSEYWQILERYDELLQREMYIGDDADARFEINFPTDREAWPGTMTAIASSGGGKTYFIVQMLLRYYRATPMHQRRACIWISPELTIDKTLKPLRDNKKLSMWFHGIDISEQNLRKKGMDAASFYQTEIVDKIESIGENALIVYDDFPDGSRSLYPFLERHYNSQLRVARHRNQGIISLIHTYAHGKASSQALQSNKTVIFYPRSQQSRCVQFLRDYIVPAIANAAGEEHRAPVRQPRQVDGDPDALTGLHLQWKVPRLTLKNGLPRSTEKVPQVGSSS